MKEIIEYTEKVFENIKHIEEEGNEYWLARELQVVLEYKRWDKFCNVIDISKINCEKSNNNVTHHFSQVGKMIKLGKGGMRTIDDYKLSRYACYLIVQNSDPRKQVISLGKTYFAVQTRKQELSEKGYIVLSEEEKRFYQRDLTRKRNYSLNIAARDAGVKNFDKFHNAGYKGLYNGETADDIAKRKNLRYREDILDNMCSEELIANLFRISQTESKLKRDNVSSETKANETHYIVGKNIRETILKNGGVMPEDMPTPNKSLKELEKDKNKKLPL